MFVCWQTMQTRPRDYLGLAIFSCLCCCWVSGLVAIMFSVRSRNAYGAGIYEDASKAGKCSLGWSLASIICGIVIIVIVILVNRLTYKEYYYYY